MCMWNHGGKTAGIISMVYGIWVLSNHICITDTYIFWNNKGSASFKF